MIGALMDEPPYRPLYWISAFCGIAVFLMPQTVFSRMPNGVRTAAALRVLRIVGVSGALLRLTTCIVVPVFLYELGLQDNSPAGALFELRQPRRLIGYGSMVLAAVSLRCSNQRDVGVEEGIPHISCAPIAAVSVLCGVARPMLMSACTPAARVLIPLERPSVALLLLPVFVLMAIWFVVWRVAGDKALPVALCGFMYGEILGRVVLRIAASQYLYFAERPLLVAGVCAVALGAAICLVHVPRRAGGAEEPKAAAADERPPIILDGTWSLSAREEEAVRHAFEGLSSRAAAEKMGIQPSTVRNLQRRAWSKMGVSSISEARNLLESMQPKAEFDSGSSGDDEDSRTPLLEIAAGAVLLGMCPWLVDVGTWFSPLSVCAAAGVGLLGAVLLAGFWSNGVKRDSSKVVSRTLLLAFCAAGEVISQVLAPDEFPLVVLMSSWALGWALIERDRFEKDAGPLLIVIMVCAFFGGVALFVMWKGMTWPFVAPVDQFLMPMAAHLACALAGLLLLRRFLGAALLGALCVVALAIAFAYQVYGPIYATWLFALGFSIRTGRAAGDFSFVRPILLSYGIGLMFGVGVFSRIYDMLNLRDVTLGTESALRLQLVVNYGLGILMALFIVAGALAWMGVVSGYKRHEIAKRFVTLPGQRVKSALQARGLSDLEVDIMMQTFAGETCAHIAEAVSYSMSTVYAIRHDVYRKLGVRGAEQALQTILEVASL